VENSCEERIACVKRSHFLVCLPIKKIKNQELMMLPLHTYQNSKLVEYPAIVNQAMKSKAIEDERKLYEFRFSNPVFLSHHQAEVQSKKSEIDALRRECESLDSRCPSLEREIEQEKSACISMENEETALQIQLTALNALWAEWNYKIQNLESAGQQQKKDQAEYLQDLNRIKENIKKTLQESEAHQKGLQKQREEIAALRADLKTKEALALQYQRNIEELKSLVESIKNEKLTLQKQNAKDIRKLKAHHNSQMLKAHSRIKNMDGLLKKLNQSELKEE